MVAMLTFGKSVHDACRIIRLNSPNLNYLLILGAVLIYLTGIVFVIPTNDPGVLPALCIVSSCTEFHLIELHVFSYSYIIDVCPNFFYVGACLVSFCRVFLWIWNQCGKAVESLLHIQVFQIHE